MAVRDRASKRQKDVNSTDHLVNDITPISHLQPAWNANVAVGLHVCATLKSGACKMPEPTEI